MLLKHYIAISPEVELSHCVTDQTRTIIIWKRLELNIS